jgi:hypothetical protein
MRSSNSSEYRKRSKQRYHGSQSHFAETATHFTASHPRRRDCPMGYIKRKLMFIVSRFLMKSRWGRRLLWMWALHAMRSRVREFVRDIAALYPVLKPAAAWV